MQDEEDKAAIHFQSDLRSVHSNVLVLPEDEVQPRDRSGSACGDGVQVLHQTLQMGHFLGEFVRLIRLREREPCQTSRVRVRTEGCKTTEGKNDKPNRKRERERSTREGNGFGARE